MEPFKFSFGESIRTNDKFINGSQPVVAAAAQPVKPLKDIGSAGVRCSATSFLLLPDATSKHLEVLILQGDAAYADAQFTPERFAAGNQDDRQLVLYKVLIDSTNAAQKLGISDVSVSDLISGAYEGGFKLWEGACDLTQVVCSKWLWGCDAQQGQAIQDEQILPEKLTGKRVLELGCGHGLPGIASLLAGAEVMFHVRLLKPTEPHAMLPMKKVHFSS